MVCPILFDGLVIRPVQLLEQLFDAILMRDRFVEHEFQFRRASKSEPLPKLAPHERGGAGQCAQGLLARRGIAQARVIHARMVQVGADGDLRDGDEADARIAQVARNHAADFRAHLIGHALRTRTLSHITISCQLSALSYQLSAFSSQQL